MMFLSFLRKGRQVRTNFPTVKGCIDQAVRRSIDSNEVSARVETPLECCLASIIQYYGLPIVIDVIQRLRSTTTTNLPLYYQETPTRHTDSIWKS
jgi:hypothetical protein